MTYRDYIDNLNQLYAERHMRLFTLVETEKDGTFPILEVVYDTDEVEHLNIDEEIKRLDKKIYDLVLAASEEPWYRMHCGRHTQTYEILVNGVPAGVLSEKPKHDFSTFVF